MVTVWSKSDAEARALQAKTAKDILGRNVYRPEARPWQQTIGVPDYWQQDVDRMRRIGDREKYTPYARQQQEAARAQQLGALDMLRNRAMGGRSIAREEADVQRQKIAQAIASQLAGQQRTPMAVRGAQMAQSGALTDLAAQTELAAAKEKLAAQQAYLQGAQGLRGQDIGMFGAEQSQEQALRNWLLQREQMAADYAKTGLGEKYTLAGMRQQYEQLKTAQDMALLDQAIRAQLGQQSDSGTDWGSIIGGLGGMAAGIGLLAAGSDPKIKKNIEYVSSGLACKRALEDGNIPLYQYLEAQAKQQDNRQLVGNTGVSRPNIDPNNPVLANYQDPSNRPGWGQRIDIPNETHYKLGQPNVMGYGGTQRETPRLGYNPTEEWYNEFRRDWRRPEVPPMLHQQENPGRTGPQFWMPQKVTSGEACKKALENGDMELYNFLQAQANVNQAKGISPSSLSPLETDLVLDRYFPYTTTGGTPTSSGVTNPNFAVSVPYGSAQVVAKGIPQPSLDTDMALGRTSPYTMTGGAPTSSGAINPDFAVSMPSGSEQVVEKGVPEQETNKMATAQGVKSIFSGMGDIINEINRTDGPQDLWKGVSRGYPASTKPFLGMINQPNQPTTTRQGLQMIASDPDLKEDIGKDNKLYDFMDKMNAVQFDYKDPEKYGEGRRTGVLADEVALSELGNGMVEQDMDGNLMLDVSPQKFNPLVMASLAHLHKRVKNLEGGE